MREILDTGAEADQNGSEEMTTEGYLDEMEINILDEIGNISFGSSATSMFIV